MRGKITIKITRFSFQNGKFSHIFGMLLPNSELILNFLYTYNYGTSSPNFYAM
jgi:hypothetical protein